MAASRHHAVVIAILISHGVGALGASLRSDQRVTPTEKVITLLKDLHAEVKQEGTAESSEYATFACFCQDQTKGTSSETIQYEKEIGVKASDIADKVAKKAVDAQDLENKRKEKEDLDALIAETKAQFEKDRADYDAAAADLSKAISGLQGALTSLEDAKPPGEVLLSLRDSVTKGSTLSTAMDSKLPKTPSADAIKAFLQGTAGVDPSDPEYKYHSHGIIETLTNLLADFTSQKTTLDAEWGVSKSAFEESLNAHNMKLASTKQQILSLQGSIETLKLGIASDRADLVTAEKILKEGKLLMRDLTERCEARAHDWDQRSVMRADELKAIEDALEVLEGTVKGLDEEVNNRTLLQSGKHSILPHTSLATAPQTLKRASVGAFSFVQGVSVKSHDHRTVADSATRSKAQNDAIAMLAKEGQRLQSQPLSTLAMRLTSDPFASVKALIQKLIERLLRESISEATKEGFCNTELGKAKEDRKFRFSDVKKLNTETAGLELKQDQLESEILELTDAVDNLRIVANQSKQLRADEHTMNMETLDKAKKGLTAITEAIVILKTFYSQAAKAVALVQASPVDELTSGPGFEGSYGGKQQASEGIMGMLAVIKTDFQRTVTVTTEQEKKSSEEFVQFDRATQTDISGKTTKIELDEEDLKVTVATIEDKMSELTRAQSLLDTALKKLEELKPMCTDFGMDYATRVEKRQEEIKALEKVLCILVPEGVNVEGCKVVAR